MNIKKMFTALSAMVVAVTMTLPSASVFGAEYSQELQDAYNWAYGKGVTTMSPIDNANMYGAITRAEMAKMLSVYAKEVLGKELNTSAACTFSDIDSVKGDLHDFIIESCQLGIMGQGITAFRPYDTISRAEFGTALSRVLWGSEYEGGTPYYANHLNALKANAIMNQIANAESTKEIRGYVMLMLMRSEQWGAGVDCDEPTIALACLDPELDTYKNCPAACREDANKDEDGVVKSGDLAVTAKAASDRKVIVSGEDGTEATVSDLDTLTFKTSEEVEISKVVLERYGYSSNEDVESVWLEDEDGNVITNEATLNTKGQANLTVKKDYRKVDGTFSATVVLKMKAGTPAGKTIWFKVLDVNCTAKNLDLGNYNPYTYETVVYTGAEVSFTVRWTTKEYNLEAGKSYEVSKFKVKAPADSALLVKGFTLTNLAGTKVTTATDTDNNYDYSDLNQLDVEKYLDKVTVKVGGKEVKASAKINKDDELVISFDEEVELAAKENAEFSVEMSFAEDFDAYKTSIVYAIAKSSHFNAIDAKTQSRVSMPNDETMAGMSWPTYTILGGKVKLTNVKLGNVDGAIDSVDVKVAEGNITVGETIKWDLTVTITPNPVAWAVIAMRLNIGDDVDMEGTPDNKTAPTKFTFNNVEIEKGGKVEILVDITDKNAETYEWKQYGFTIDGWDSFHYTEGKTSDKVDIAGSITPSKLTIQAARASLTRDLTKDVEFKNKAADRKPIFEGTYTAKKGAVKLNEFILSWNGAWTSALLEKNNVTFYLLIDGEEVADAKLWSNFKTSDTFSEVEVDAGKSVKITVEAEVNAKNGDIEDPIELGNFDFTIKGEDNNGNKAGEITKKTAKLKVVESWTAKISDATVSTKTVTLKKANAVLAEFKLTPANGASEVDLDYLAFTSDAGLTPADVTVEIDGVEEFATSTSALTYAPTTTIDKDGVVVKVMLNDEDKAVDTINLTVTDINADDAVNEVFTKTFASALVYIKKQEQSGKEYTKYTLGVEKYDDSDSIVGLKLYTNTNCSSGALTLVGIEPTDKLTDGKTFTITALDTWAPIKCIKYTVADEPETTITTTIASDYFKVGLKTDGDDWYVYSNK